MLEELKRRVCEANIELEKRGIVIYTWGNVSERDRETGFMVIKPSGVKYDELKPEDMVVVSMEGEVIEGHKKPSSDTWTHLELYKAFEEIGGICHTHSRNAVAFAQAGRAIEALGTTHADYFYGEIPCTRELSQKEVEREYEKNTGRVIVEELNKSNQDDKLAVPGILVKNHGPFAWGKNAEEAVYHAVVMEEIAAMSFRTLMLNGDASMPQYVLDKHYFRKHGANAYYGQ